MKFVNTDEARRFVEQWNRYEGAEVRNVVYPLADEIDRLRISLAKSTQYIDGLPEPEGVLLNRNGRTEDAWGRYLMRSYALREVEKAVFDERKKVEPLLQVVEWILDAGHLNTVLLARLRSAFDGLRIDS